MVPSASYSFKLGTEMLFVISFSQNHQGGQKDNWFLNISIFYWTEIPLWLRCLALFVYEM